MARPVAAERTRPAVDRRTWWIDAAVLAAVAVLLRIPAFVASRHLTYDDGFFGLSAMEMRDGIKVLLERWKKRGHNLGFGVGIALGYATLGQIGFDRRFEYAAIGSVTNLASRLCDEAKAGQILISQRIFGLIDGEIEVNHVGDLTLKGFHRPMPAYEVVRLRA